MFQLRALPYLEKLLQQMLGCVKEDGTMEYPFFFVDWPTFQKPDAVHEWGFWDREIAKFIELIFDK